MRKNHITDYLEFNSVNFSDKQALICIDKQMSWAELNHEVELRVDYFIEKLGIKDQKIVGLLMPNTWQFVVSYLAVIKAGHIAMPIDVIYKPLEISAIVNQMKPALIVSDEPGLKRLNGALDAVLFDNLPLSSPMLDCLQLDANQQVASLVFTSGTTGKPKAAPYTHANHLWNIDVCSQAWGWNSDDTMLISLRLSHWYGICMGLSGAIYHGNTMYLQENFDARTTLQTLAAEKISLFTHTPLAYNKIVEENGDYDLSSLRLAISGSAPLSPDVWQKFKDKFSIEIIETYGSSESGRIASNTFLERVSGSPGRPLKDVKIKFSNKQELLVKSPGLFPGYYLNPSLTQENLDNEGFWKTGDTAELIDGRIILKGRLQERIRKNSYSISPRDVEWALRENSAVSDAIVLGSTGQGSDSIITYFLVTSATEAEIVNYTKANLPSIWRADKIVLLGEIPRTPNGKADLEKLKALL